MNKLIEQVQLNDGSWAIKCTLLVILTGKEIEKFSNKSLKKQIDAAAKDLKIEWTTEKNGSITMALISRIQKTSFGDNEIHELEIAASNFMSFIEKMEIKETKPETKSITEDDINFVEALLEDWDGQESDAPIVGFMPVMAPSNWTRVVIGELTVPKHVAKEMCELFLKTHKHG